MSPWTKSLRFTSCSVWLCQGLGGGVFWSPGQSPVSSVCSPCGEPVPEHRLFSRHSSDNCCAIVVCSKNLRCFPALYVSGFCNPPRLTFWGIPITSNSVLKRKWFPSSKLQTPRDRYCLWSDAPRCSSLIELPRDHVCDCALCPVHPFLTPSRSISAHLSAIRRHGSIKILSIL